VSENILRVNSSEQGGDGGVQFRHLQKHGAILRSNVADALDTAQSRDIECFRCAARGGTPLSAPRRLRRSIRRGVPRADFPAVIDDGHAVAEAFGFVHVVGW